jgi:carbonic anhydrase
MIYRINFTELENIEDEESIKNRLTELNVMEQVSHLSVKNSHYTKSAWKKRQGPDLHGWVY